MGDRFPVQEVEREMEVSPFPHQGPIEPAQVTGRDELIAELIERLTERRVTALLGPRRYGKTSVLGRVAADLEAAGSSVVWIDLYEATSMSDVALRIDAGLGAARGPVHGGLVERSLGIGLHLGMLQVEFARKKSERPEPEAMLHLLLDALVAAAAHHPTIVVIDEFAGAAGIPGVLGLLRTKLQHHFQQIGFVFAGSQPSMMRSLFTDRSQPFYAQADLVEITPFSAAVTAAIIDTGFRSTDRDPGDLAVAIHRFTAGHPYRTMQFADAAWRISEPDAPFDRGTWAAALAAMRTRTSLGIETLFSSYDKAEKSVLRLAAHRRPLFGADAELLGLSSSSAYAVRDRLVASGELVADDHGGYDLVDPIVADWIRQRFT